MCSKDTMSDAIRQDVKQTAHDSPTVERNFSGVTLKRVPKANNGRLRSSSQPKAIEVHVDRFQNIRTNPDISFLRSLSSDNYNGSAWNGTGGYSNARIGVPYTTINKAGVHYSTSPSDSSNHQGSATIFRATRSPLKSDLWPTYVTWSPRSKFAYGDRYCTYGNSEKDSVKEDREELQRHRQLQQLRQQQRQPPRRQQQRQRRRPPLQPQPQRRQQRQRPPAPALQQQQQLQRQQQRPQRQQPQQQPHQQQQQQQQQLPVSNKLNKC
ncbi:unnamed protein product [Rotaria magnacalcarata]|uniref:Uncharacterized protein n=1 Tax=Rotaria magnacalcarata TaxID=392030 RepID=A0A816ZLQ3_9BILA|nr:unnamed protein product [Rotaria magnacalcarata]